MVILVSREFWCIIICEFDSKYNFLKEIRNIPGPYYSLFRKVVSMTNFKDGNTSS